MTDFVMVCVLLFIVGGAAAYITKAKKSGVKCIGCPSGRSCSGKKGNDQGCCCGCHSTENS